MRIRQSIRALRASPGITVASIVILALGIGASTAVFSVVNGLLLRPLAVAGQDRLVFITKTDLERAFDHFPIVYPEYLEWSRRSRELHSLAALWAWQPLNGVLLSEGDPRRLPVDLVSGNFFEVLGSSPARGRTLGTEDDLETTVPPLVLSHRAWRDHFASDPLVVGRIVSLRLAEHTSFQVVGVMPEAFNLFQPAEAWAPILAVQPDWAGGLACECDLVGRLARDSTPERALAELQTIHENLAAEQSDRYRPIRVVISPLLQSVVGDGGRASILAFGSVAILLAIAVANVAGLSLIRALGRTREVAVRSALGAGAVSLLRERLVESALISTGALTGGFLVARVGIDGLLVLKGADLPRIQEISVDSRAFLFATGIACLATAICASLPAIFGPGDSLRSRKLGSQRRTVQWMVAAQIALALPLLFASALLARTLLASASIERGFDAENLLTLEIPLPPSKYPDPETRLEFYEGLVGRVEALPGVVAATGFGRNPGSGSAGVTGQFLYEGQNVEEARNNPMTSVEVVTPSHFAVLGIPIVRGRSFESFDDLDSERVAIVSEGVAATYWPGQDPIGKTLGFPDVRSRVVGVAANTRYRELTKPWPTVYFPIRQNPFSMQRRLHPLLNLNVLAVRTRLPPENLAGPVRSIVRSLDRELSVDRVATMDELLDLELRAPRFHAVAASFFSLIALLLAATGVYSVFAAFVAQRLPELGIRSALGATPNRLRAMVLTRSGTVILIGVVAGGIGALFLSRLLGAFLYGVAPFDVPSLAGATALLALVSLAATWVPARRAARVDPLLVLKHE